MDKSDWNQLHNIYISVMTTVCVLYYTLGYNVDWVLIIEVLGSLQLAAFRWQTTRIKILEAQLDKS